MKTLSTLFMLFLFIVIGCIGLNKRIEITPEYIINENWSKRGEKIGSNSITINKMKLKRDSSINPFSDLLQPEIMNKLEDDSSFMHYTNVKIKPNASYKDTKIYFNKDNDFYWGGKDPDDDTTNIIGNLQPSNWYKFSHLVGYPYYIYIYVDSTNKAHRFDVNLANY